MNVDLSKWQQYKILARFVQVPMPRIFLIFPVYFLFFSCEPRAGIDRDDVVKSADLDSKYVIKLAPIIDPSKLSSLTLKRAATPRLRKACYWLEMARRDGHELSSVLTQAYELTGHDRASPRESEQSAALIRNMTILKRLGCLENEGMEKLRRGKAPTITRGPYAGQLATGDHIIPRSIAPELDNALFNLEFLPEKLNQSKGNKVSIRQVQLAQKWYEMGFEFECSLWTVFVLVS